MLARTTRVLLGLPLALLAAGCSSETFSQSGYLPDYSMLKVEDAPAGGDRMFWVSPDFTPANYKALILDPMVFYPEPKPGPQVSAETLDSIRNYMDSTMREALGSSVQLTSTPGPGVARLGLAITAVGTETDDMEVYQFIPIALVITGAMALAEGGLPQEPKIAVELQVVDSSTRKPLLYLVRAGTGEHLDTAKVEGIRPVALDALKELFDHWTEVAAKEVQKYIAPRPR
jgi:hypothetical protein